MHNHLKKLMYIQSLGFFQEVGLSLVEVKHDLICSIFFGGECDCDPDLYSKGQRIETPKIQQIEQIQIQQNQAGKEAIPGSNRGGTDN